MNRETVAYLLSGERREDILAGDKHIPLFKKQTKNKKLVFGQAATPLPDQWPKPKEIQKPKVVGVEEALKK